MPKISASSPKNSISFNNLATRLIDKQNSIRDILEVCQNSFGEDGECTIVIQKIRQLLKAQQLATINITQRDKNMALAFKIVKPKNHYCRTLFTNNVLNESQKSLMKDYACGDINVDIIKRPTIAVEYGSKVATNIRQRYLNVFCDEFLKIYSKTEDAYERAKQEEQAVYDRSTSRTVYLNVAVNAVKRFRNEAAANTSKESSALLKSSSKRSASTGIANQPASKKMSHEAMLGGAKAAKLSYSVKRSISRTISLESLTELDLYKLLEPYILIEEDLEKHGFPRLGPDKSGKAVVLRNEVKQVNCSDTINRTCARCNKTFRISPSGHYITKEECVYHWGKAWKKKIAGNLETRYTCCQGDSESDGCCLAKVHVSDYKDYDNLVGFVSTQPKSPLANKNYGTFALDCEMCYTANGAELTRITVIGTNLKPVYETLVKPDSPIVDYNTRFSGITEIDMKNVTTTLRDVQAVLLSTFSDKTILIGHSLESDFMALKLIHNTVIDTSIVFPHRLGLPYKRALRTLMAEYIKKIIQADTSGHDSQEDAAACMELMLWKIKEDLKKLLR